MEEKFEVVYDGHVKEFETKSRALSHALVVESLGFESDVYYCVKILSVEMRVKIYSTHVGVYDYFKNFKEREVEEK